MNTFTVDSDTGETIAAADGKSPDNLGMVHPDTLATQEVSALFSRGKALLAVIGDGSDNTVTISRDSGGQLLVNGGAVHVAGSTPTVDNTSTIQVLGFGGDDVIALDESNGALPAAVLFGGSGNDTLTGGSSADQLSGQTGNDTLNGRAGNDLLSGGEGDDQLTGGLGNDQLSGDAGNDRFLWSPGDGSDSVDGGSGSDTLVFSGSNIGEEILISASGSHIGLKRDVGNVTMDLTGVEQIQINARGGADHIVVNDLSGTDAKTVAVDLADSSGLIGDAAADRVDIVGSDTGDRISLQGDGNSVTVAGLAANVTVSHGEAGDSLAIKAQAGDDVIDASALNAVDIHVTIDGGTGNDTLRLDGSAAADNIAVLANGSLATLSRDGSAAPFELSSVERIQLNALAGADHIVIGDLSGTEVKTVAVDLGGSGDGQADNLGINGTTGADSILVSTAGNETVISGLAAEVRVSGADAGLDQLQINAGAQSDAIDASGLAAGTLNLMVDAGDGDDVVVGSAGNDVITGGRGADVASLGAGDDSFVWNPGDGSDTVDGQGGSDTLLFNGANIGETFTVSDNGGRVRFTRDVGTVTMDLNGLEHINLRTLSGADTIIVNDTTGTELSLLDVDLAGGGTPGAGDAVADKVVINATNGDDVITLSLQDGALVVDGLGARTVIEHFDANDSISIAGLDGDDIVDATGLGAGGPSITLDGGNGNDILIGGAGSDLVLGGAGEDVLLGGAGADLLDGGEALDVEIQDTVTVGSPGIATLGGNDLDDTITVSRDAAGNILGNAGAIAIAGAPTVANTSLVRVFGKAGDDVLTLDESNGALPAAALFGGSGNDMLSAGSGADQLFGGSGNDTLLGNGGADQLFGGDGNDVLTGGAGADQLFGEGGDDRIVWNPGDGSDVAEGGAGTDTLEVNGGNGAEVFTITPNADHVRVDRVSPAPFSIDAGTTESIVINAKGGDDIISASNGLSTLVQLTIDGGTGNDTITGGDGADVLLAGDGDDVVTGGRGADVASLGAGDDSFVWNPGDGSDTVDGQGGSDTLLFNGANIGETFTVSANGGRVRFTRDIGSVTMDLDDVETLHVNALGGSDHIVVEDLGGTDVTQVNVDLRVTGGAGDGLVDSVDVIGTRDGDRILVQGGLDSLTVAGLAANVSVNHGEAIDRLVIKGDAGNDVIETSQLGAGTTHLSVDGGTGNDTLDVHGGEAADTINVAADADHVGVFDGSGAAAFSLDTVAVEDVVISAGGGDDVIVAGNGLALLATLTLDGGEGDDRITGGDGSDVLLGGDGNDVVTGGRGADVASLGAGDDHFVWSPGDGSDVVDGQGGSDTLLFNGSNIGEKIDILANGERVNLLRNVGTVTMDLDNIERIGVLVLDGDDTITVHDLSGTDSKLLDLDLADSSGTADGSTDAVFIEGTSGNDTITLSMHDGSLVIDGLAAQIVIEHFDAGDQIHLMGLGGNDVIDASALADGGPSLFLVGGDGDDLLLGGAGDDLLQGDAGDDVLIGGAGQDVLDGGPGANVLIQ